MEQKIIKEYTEGKSISKLLIDYPQYNRRQINKILSDNNIAIRGGRKKKMFTEQQIDELKQKIEEGAFLYDLSEYFNMDQETIKKRMKELHLSFKNHNRVNRRIDSNYFSIIDSPIKAYWLGFLFTDGSVDQHKSKGRVRLQLQEKDLEILEYFKKDLKLDCQIIYDRRPNSCCCSVEFSDEQIFNDLSKYGIIPNKTYKTKNIPYDKIPKEYLSAFALGLFDGDGNFYCSEDCSSDVTFGYTAYHETEVEDFQEIINSLTNINHKNRIYYTSAWHTQWRGRLQVLKILDVLYENCPRYLKRKHDIYIKLKNSLN